jgi:hypothetical protein
MKSSENPDQEAGIARLSLYLLPITPLLIAMRWCTEKFRFVSVADHASARR